MRSHSGTGTSPLLAMAAPSREDKLYIYCGTYFAESDESRRVEMLQHQSFHDLPAYTFTAMRTPSIAHMSDCLDCYIDIFKPQFYAIKADWKVARADVAIGELYDGAH